MLKLAGETDIGILEAHETSLSPHLVETLPVTLKGGNLLHIAVNAGWSETITGSGGTLQRPGYQKVKTGITANSSARLLTDPAGLNPGAGYFKVNWNKKLYIIIASYIRDASDSQAVARFQLRENTGPGALDATGIGFQVDNLAIKGESHGTALGVLDLNTALTNDYDHQIAMIHYPGSKIEWYVNGVLKGTQSTAAYIPSGESATYTYLVHYIANGAAGGVDAMSYLSSIVIWQER